MGQCSGHTSCFKRHRTATVPDHSEYKKRPKNKYYQKAEMNPLLRGTLGGGTALHTKFCPKQTDISKWLEYQKQQYLIRCNQEMQKLHSNKGTMWWSTKRNFYKMSAKASFTQVWTKVTVDYNYKYHSSTLKAVFWPKTGTTKNQSYQTFYKVLGSFYRHCSKNTTLEYIWIKNKSTFLNTQKMTMSGTQRNSINASSTKLISTRLTWLSESTL